MKKTTTRTERNAGRIAAEFDATHADIARLIDVLHMELEKRAASAERTWGGVADLAMVRDRLLDTVAFISGMEREEVERFLEDANAASEAVHTDTIVRGDGKRVTVRVPRS